MEDMKAALAAKGYDIVEKGSDSDSDEDPFGRIQKLEPELAREKGKKAFEKQKYDKAIKYWQGGLKSILSALCSGPEAMGNMTLSELDLTLNLNIAMAQMKKGEYDQADRSVDKALARREALPPNLITKALYRKASVQRELHRLEGALETLKDLLQVEEGHAAARQMYQEIEREWSRQVNAQKANFRKMFSKIGDEDKKHEELRSKERAEIRSRCGVVWKSDEDVDSEAFDAGETPGSDGKDWGLSLNRTLLWSIEQFALEGRPCMEPGATHLSIWLLGASSTCELRWIQPSTLMSRLPGIQHLEIVLIGFLGELDPENKRIPDPKAEGLSQDWAHTELDGGRRVSLRAFCGNLQDAVDQGIGPPKDGNSRDIDPKMKDSAASTGGYNTAESSANSSTDNPPVAAAATEEIRPPNVTFVAHPQLHRYYTDFFPAMRWLIQKSVPTVIIGASEPDHSWKQDEPLLTAYGANLVVGKRLSPYPMCLPDSVRIRKCSHIIGFCGGKAIEKDRLTKVKIELLSQDYHVR